MTSAEDVAREWLHKNCVCECPEKDLAALILRERKEADESRQYWFDAADRENKRAEAAEAAVTDLQAKHGALVDEYRAVHMTNTYLEAESARLSRELEGEREARSRLDHAYREKDRAMGVLFKRLDAAGVDCSDLIS